eukprot:TRINITY_DN25684_c0_g3_i1.p1 TRINITY_DN25684_c0_g3~~TRINITY_DN25684_c0_g3_i1.p1  ORF type:complete len:545 (+),score=82.88 TRINITY_DN25684_c0_g3_i1:236-1636(+)
MAQIYHERQLGGLCGVHCLNNLLQGPYFGPGDLAEIGVELDREETRLLHSATISDPNSAGHDVGRVAYNVDSSADGGNFSIQVLTRSLQRFGLDLLPSRHPRARELMRDPSTATEAYLCQHRDHWFAIRQVSSCWWNLNSTRAKPGLVSHFHLAAWLGQLSEDGYSIFLVVGGSLPAPAARSTNTSTAQSDADTYHDMCALLEAAARGGDDPLAGGNPETDELLLPPEEAVPSAPPSSRLSACRGVVAPSCSSVTEEALVSMGFAQSAAAAALELAAGDSELRSLTLSGVPSMAQEAAIAEWASGMLARARGADEWALQGGNEAGARLGRALQDAVGALDRRGHGVPEAILRVVSLLSVPGELLQEAARHVDACVLTEFLYAVVEANSQAWRPEQLRAATVALELAAKLPGSSSAPRARRRASTLVLQQPGGESTNGRGSSHCGQQGDKVISLDALVQEEERVIEL